MNLVFRTATPDDAERCHRIEADAYPAGEAATPAKIAKRIQDYPQGFLLLEVDATIAGFINSGCAQHVDMADESFKDLTGHDPEAPNSVILSVVVDRQFQRRGLAKKLMAEFVRHMQSQNKETIHLMCKDPLIGFYQTFGFEYVQPSSSDHGGAQWHEMILMLRR